MLIYYYTGSACGEAWRNHLKRNVVPMHALIAALISRKEVIFSKFGGKIKFSDYRAILKKQQVEKNMLVGLVNIPI